MGARTALLVVLVGLVPMEGVLAQGPVVSYPQEYRTSLVKYAVVTVTGLHRKAAIRVTLTYVFLRPAPGPQRGRSRMTLR